LSERIKIEIFDQIYHISGDLERAYVEQLAAFVDANSGSAATVSAKNCASAPNAASKS
jgi:hypothetical protein